MLRKSLGRNRYACPYVRTERFRRYRSRTSSAWDRGGLPLRTLPQRQPSATAARWAAVRLRVWVAPSRAWTSFFDNITSPSGSFGDTGQCGLTFVSRLGEAVPVSVVIASRYRAGSGYSAMRECVEGAAPYIARDVVSAAVSAEGAGLSKCGPLCSAPLERPCGSCWAACVVRPSARSALAAWGHRSPGSSLGKPHLGWLLDLSKALCRILVSTGLGIGR